MGAMSSGSEMVERSVQQGLDLLRTMTFYKQVEKRDKWCRIDYKVQVPEQSDVEAQHSATIMGEQRGVVNISISSRVPDVSSRPTNVAPEGRHHSYGPQWPTATQQSICLTHS